MQGGAKQDGTIASELQMFHSWRRDQTISICGMIDG